MGIADEDLVEVVGGFIGEKLGKFVLDLAKTELLDEPAVLAFLKKRGYAKPENTFESVYVHALATRKLAGIPVPILDLFRHSPVVVAFETAYRDGRQDRFDEKAKWAVQAFKEGDDIRGLGLDIEGETQRLYATFCEIVEKLRNPTELEPIRLLREVQTKLERLTLTPTLVVPTPAEVFEHDLVDWLEACGYHRLSETNWFKGRDFFDVVFEQPDPRPGRRKPRKYLIRGKCGRGDGGNFHDLPLPEAQNVDETWLVASIELTDGARQMSEKCSDGRYAFTFDDLVDNQVDFSKYEAFLRNEIERRKIPEYYVSLACHVPEVDQKGEVRARSTYTRLESHVDQWLERPIEEHLSILGEFGMGKTWFCLWYTWWRLQAYHDAKVSGRPRGRYPLLITLREYAKEVSAPSLLSLLFFDRYEVGLPSMRAFQVLNRMGRFLLLFDGFDEMAQKVDYQKVVNNFWSLAKVIVRGAKAILTCREEHFRYAREARSVLGAKEMASTEKIILVPPRFLVLHLEPFDSDRLRGAIVKRLGPDQGPSAAKAILAQTALADLARRPVMVEMVLSTLDELLQRAHLTISEVYLLATERQMRLNILQERTFTSMRDKLAFLCELAWEMQAQELLKLHYKQFPDRIRALFGERVAEEEKDHWEYDLRVQTLLVRDEHGQYAFAHRGFVEYFAAYRLLAHAGALDVKFVEKYKDGPTKDAFPTSLGEKSAEDLIASWGKAPFQPNLLRFLGEMVGSAGPLFQLVKWTQSRDDIGYLGGNAASVLVKRERAAFANKNISGASLRSAVLLGANMSGVLAIGTDFRASNLFGADLSRGNCAQARFDGATATGHQARGTLAADEQGRILFGGSSTGGWVFNLEQRRFVAIYGIPSFGWACDRAVSPNGTWLLHAKNDEILLGEIVVEGSAVHWRRLALPIELAKAVPGVCWHPAGWFLIVYGNQAFRVNPVDGGVQCVATLPHGSRAPGIAACPPFWILGAIYPTRVWQEHQHTTHTNFRCECTMGERPEVDTKRGQVTIANENGLHVYRVSDWTCIKNVVLNSACRTHAIDVQMGRVAVFDNNRKNLLVLSSEDWEVIARIPFSFACGLTFASENRLVAVDEVGTIHIFDLNTDKITETFPQPTMLCEDTIFRNATGLDDALRSRLLQGGAIFD